GMLTIAAVAHGSDSFWKVASSNGVSFGSQCYSSSAAPSGCSYSMGSVFLLEVVLTFLFVLVIQLITREESGAKNLAPLGIGLTLMVTNLVAIPIDGASINPVPGPCFPDLDRVPLGFGGILAVLDRADPRWPARGGGRDGDATQTIVGKRRPGFSGP
ncbi:MAG: aquaporin, partial [Thermoplasmata archaeon]|nr:aquaporin [Thermoplasmata archaeon]